MVKSKNEKIAEIKEEEKNVNNLLFNYYFTNYQSPSNMYKKTRETNSKRNKDQVYWIEKILNEIKKEIKNVPKNKKFELNKKIIIIFFVQIKKTYKTTI